MNTPGMRRLPRDRKASIHARFRTRAAIGELPGWVGSQISFFTQAGIRICVYSNTRSSMICSSQSAPPTSSALSVVGFRAPKRVICPSKKSRIIVMNTNDWAIGIAHSPAINFHHSSAIRLVCGSA
ncbi:hypothetical protein KIK06_14995 [Nocardiopsis sp. EMB25]|nr:hypothetical protein [Nocardiopsis sp. EMB25]